MKTNMEVVKRDGRKEPVSFDKIHDRLKRLAAGTYKDGVRFGPELDVDVTPISQQVIMQIRDGITTKELDEFAADTTAMMVTEHPHYSELAGRIIISNHHKNTRRSFVDTMKDLYANVDVHGNPSPLINNKTYKAIIDNASYFDDLVDYKRDYLINYFGFKTLERAYLLKSQIGHITVRERPQYMYLRVAVGMWQDDLEKVKETYDLLSLQKLSHASPTLFNCGTPHPQNSSCFLMGMEDSIDGIYSCLKKCALISKHSGGIGIWASDVRAKSSRIRGTNGNSDGIIPMLRVFNETGRYVNQGGKRKGSIAVYLEPHHADVEDFLDLKKTHGDQSRRALDLFLAMWISDLFMKRLDQSISNGYDKSVMWSLFCPDEAPGLTDVYGEEYERLYLKYESEKKYRKQIPIIDLWNRILTSHKETGVPYMLYKDCANYRNQQENIGIVKSSNLCVAPDTMILTDRGYHKISDLEGLNIRVWNGEKFSNTVVAKTGENQEMMEVEFSNGSELKCTPYHKFYIQKLKPKHNPKNMHTNTKYVEVIEAKDLKEEMKIIKCDFPVIEGKESFPYAYTHGAFCGDGTYDDKRGYEICGKTAKKDSLFCGRHLGHDGLNGYNLSKETTTCIAKLGNRPRLTLYGDKKKLEKYLDQRCEAKMSNGRLDCRLPLDLPKKFEVPMNATTKDKLDWLAGYADTDGTVAKNGTNESLQLSSINKEFLEKIKLMLQTLGCDPKVTKNRDADTRILPDGKGGKAEYKCQAVYRLLLNSNDLYKIHELGFNPRRLKVSGTKPQRNARQFITVKSTKKLSDKSDTFCFTEKDRGMGIFNGIITGQCAEILLANSPKDETISVCNLAAVPLGSFADEENKTFDFEGLANSVRVGIRNLNRVIDVNFYPVEDCAKSNFRDRPVGLGVIGLYDAFAKLKMPFDSPEAKKLNFDIFECMYYNAVETSMELSKVEGPYDTFKGSPASKGKLQIDLWNEDRVRFGHEPTHYSTDKYDWDSLKEQVKEHGLRNSTLMALMPTASSAQIIGQNESFECMTYNLYVRRVLSGDFKLVNKYLQKDLWDRWIVD